jgi:hypothetical protein
MAWSISGSLTRGVHAYQQPEFHTVKGEASPSRDHPHVSGSGPAISMRQHNLTSLDLIEAKTSRDLAMWTNDGGLAGDRNP